MPKDVPEGSSQSPGATRSLTQEEIRIVGPIAIEMITAVRKGAVSINCTMEAINKYDMPGYLQNSTERLAMFKIALDMANKVIKRSPVPI